jgi:hypothetical protein
VSLEARDGRLMPVLNSRPRDPNDTGDVTLWEDAPCDRAILSRGLSSFTEVEYFIPDTATLSLPQSSLHGLPPVKGAPELWVEVTVPAEGPPRPIQLALSDASGFHPLKFD